MTSSPGRRCLGWLGAVVLFVLLAAAGQPAAGRAFVGAEPVAARCEVACVGAPGRSAPVAVHAAARALLSTRKAPRPLGRQRSVQCRGLPPPRAPTA